MTDEHASRIVAVDCTMIRRFAEAIGADDPIHYDEAAAARAGLPGLAAPLTFPIALKSMVFPNIGGDRLLIDVLESLSADVADVLHGEQDISARRPVFAGDLVRIESEIEAVEPQPDKRMTFIRERTTFMIGTGEPIAESRATYVVRHREPPER